MGHRQRGGVAPNTLRRSMPIDVLFKTPPALLALSKAKATRHVRGGAVAWQPRARESNHGLSDRPVATAGTLVHSASMTPLQRKTPGRCDLPDLLFAIWEIFVTRGTAQVVERKHKRDRADQ